MKKEVFVNWSIIRVVYRRNAKQSRKAETQTFFVWCYDIFNKWWFPNNKLHIQSIRLFASFAFRCPDRAHQLYFHSLFLNMPLPFDVNRPRKLWLCHHFHFLNSSNVKVFEKQKKRDVTTRMKKYRFKNKKGDHGWTRKVRKVDKTKHQKPN